jgi:hypothetical protein
LHHIAPLAQSASYSQVRKKSIQGQPKHLLIQINPSTTICQPPHKKATK